MPIYKACKVHLVDAYGTPYAWTVRRFAHGWTFVDHERYERYAGKTWLEVVQRVTTTADNYNLTATIS